MKPLIKRNLIIQKPLALKGYTERTLRGLHVVLAPRIVKEIRKQLSFKMNTPIIKKNPDLRWALDGKDGLSHYIMVTNKAKLTIHPTSYIDSRNSRLVNGMSLILFKSISINIPFDAYVTKSSKDPASFSEETMNTWISETMYGITLRVSDMDIIEKFKERRLYSLNKLPQHEKIKRRNMIPPLRTHPTSFETRKPKT